MFLLYFSLFHRFFIYILPSSYGIILFIFTALPNIFHIFQMTEKYYGRLGIEKGIVMGNGPLEEQGKNLGEYFYYSAGLDEKDSWLKLEEIESHLQRKRCVGVKLYPGYYELYPNDKSLYPIYKMTEEYGKVLSVHTGMVAGNGGHLKYCRPIHLDDIATDFPGLKIVMCHFGNPFLQEAAAV